MEELAEQFSIDRVGRSGARFDPDKARWFNHQYLIKKDNAELAKSFALILDEKNVEYRDMTFLEKIIELVKERVNFASEIWGQASFFFAAP